MRITIVSPEFPPNNIGGGGVVVEEIARSLALHNKVTVVFGTRSFTGVVDHENLSFIPVPLISLPSSASSLATSMPPTVGGLISLLRELTRRRPNIVHLHGVGHMIVDLAAILCLALRIPYIIVCHGLPLASNPHQAPIRILYRAYENLIGSRTLRRATFVIAVSNRIASSLQQNGVDPARIRVSYHLPNPRPFPTRGDFREQHQISRNKKIILFLGSVSYRKGADIALEIAHDLLKLRNDFVLCLVGPDGGMLSEAKRQADKPQLIDYIKVLGPVKPSEKEEALQASELVLFPSRDEPYGLVPLEAITRGKPVLVSIHSGVAELLKDSELLFDPNEVSLACYRIDKMLDKPDLVKKLVQEATKAIEAVSTSRETALYEELSIKSISGSRVS